MKPGLGDRRPDAAAAGSEGQWMPEPLWIDCVTRSDRTNPDERIVRVGGINSAGRRWSMSQSDAIAGIEAGTWDFHVTAGGRTVRVIVEVSRFGQKYLKTEADREQPENLLSQPDCHRGP